MIIDASEYRGNEWSQTSHPLPDQSYELKILDIFIKETKILVYWKLKNTKYLITLVLQAKFWSQLGFVFRIENWRFKSNWRFRIENVKFKNTEKLARRIKF